jgi:hypothetical protein
MRKAYLTEVKIVLVGHFYVLILTIVSFISVSLESCVMLPLGSSVRHPHRHCCYLLMRNFRQPKVRSLKLSQKYMSRIKSSSSYFGGGDVAVSHINRYGELASDI